MGHAKEPWFIDKHTTTERINRHLHCVWQIVSDEVGVCIVILPCEDKTDGTVKEREATANRIVACVNALAGITDPAAAVERWKAIEKAASVFTEPDLPSALRMRMLPKLGTAISGVQHALALPGAEA